MALVLLLPDVVTLPPCVHENWVYVGEIITIQGLIFTAFL